jgi:hypothetical protein
VYLRESNISVSRASGPNDHCNHNSTRATTNGTNVSGLRLSSMGMATEHASSSRQKLAGATLAQPVHDSGTINLVSSDEESDGGYDRYNDG